MYKTKKPIRIIFLDTNVLNTRRTHISKMTREDDDSYDPVSVDFIDNICTKYRCYIVIMSDDRKCTNQRDWFQSKMTRCGGGFLADFLFWDSDLWRTTPKTMECKSFEIDDWFGQFDKKYHDKLDIVSHVIVTSDHIGLVNRYINNTVCVRNRSDGLCTEEFRKILRIIEGAG